MNNLLKVKDLVKYDKHGNIYVPGSLTVDCYAHAKTAETADNSDKLATTAWVRAYVSANGSGGGISTETDPIYSSEIGLYYTKVQADARYLQSFTELDPTVPAHVKAISTGNINNWTAAYTWGNHASAGYLTAFSESDPTVPAWAKQSTKPSYAYSELTALPTLFSGAYADLTGKPSLFSGSYTDLTNKPTIPTNTNQLTNGAGFITSYTETDPIWIAEKANYYTKTQGDARYLQSFTETDPIWTSEKGNYALKTYVDTSISNLVASAPAALDTLNELALALGNDANFSTSISTLIGTKEPTIAAGTTAQYWRGDKTWQTLPVYTLSGLGGVPSTRTITINGTALDLSADRSWTISTAGAYTLPIASDTTLGGIKIGSGLSIDASGVVSAAGTYTLPKASDTVLGGIKVGTNLSIDGNGVLSSTDTNTWNANSKDVAGYVSAPGAVANKVWKTDANGDPAWRDDADTTYSAFTGATTIANGASGLVTTPVIANRLQFLRGDGTWATPVDTDTTYANFTRTVAGLVPNPGGSTTTRYLREDGTWVTPPDTDTNTTYSAGTGLTLTGTVFSVTKSITTAATADTIALRDASGYINAVAFFETSDIRFKNVLETNPVVSVDGIEVIKFTLKGNPLVRYGYSAQQVKQFVPEAVSGTDKLTVNYSDVHTLKIAALERRIAELEAKLNN